MPTPCYKGHTYGWDSATTTPCNVRSRHLYELACQLDLEGVVAKRAAILYGQNARGEEWVKIRIQGIHRRKDEGLVQGGRLSVSMPHIGAVKAEEISIVACTEGLAGHDEIGHMWRQHAPSGSRTARSKTRCAQDLMSRCISIGVNVKIRH